MALDTEVCASCVAEQGLCARHESSVLPQLAQPFWYRQAHSGLWTDEKEEAIKDAATRKAERREARKRARAGLGGLLAHIRTAA